MKVAFLNTYYPPDAAITGESLAELISYLRRYDPRIEMRVYAGAATYGIGENKGASTDVEVVRIGRASRRYRGKLGRLLESISVGRRMADEALAWADVIVSLTDPPLLGLWIGRKRARAKRSVRWIEWTMDLFPEAFAAAKLVRKSNLMYKLVSASQRKNASDAYICLGEEQSRALAHLRGIKRPTVVLPCGIVPAATVGDVPSWRQREHRIVVAYAGNIGEAHCPHFLPALVETADAEQFVFLFALYGIHAPAIRERLRDRRNILWRDRIDHAELIHADVHAASLHPDWTHMCVPSKAVTTICLGRPLLFAGDPQSDTVAMLNRASWILPVPRDGNYDRAMIRSILDEMADPEKRSSKGREAGMLAETLRAQKGRALTEIASLIIGRPDLHQMP